MEKFENSDEFSSTDFILCSTSGKNFEVEFMKVAAIEEFSKEIENKETIKMNLLYIKTEKKMRSNSVPYAEYAKEKSNGRKISDVLISHSKKNLNFQKFSQPNFSEKNFLCEEKKNLEQLFSNSELLVTPTEEEKYFSSNPSIKNLKNYEISNKLVDHPTRDQPKKINVEKNPQNVEKNKKTVKKIFRCFSTYDLKGTQNTTQTQRSIVYFISRWIFSPDAQKQFSSSVTEIVDFVEVILKHHKEIHYFGFTSRVNSVLKASSLSGGDFNFNNNFFVSLKDVDFLKWSPSVFSNRKKQFFLFFILF